MKTGILVLILLLGGASTLKAAGWGFPRCQEVASLAEVLAYVPEEKTSSTLNLWHQTIALQKQRNKIDRYVAEAKHREIKKAGEIVARLRSHGYDQTAVAGLSAHHCAF